MKKDTMLLIGISVILMVISHLDYAAAAAPGADKKKESKEQIQSTTTSGGIQINTLAPVNQPSQEGPPSLLQQVQNCLEVACGRWDQETQSCIDDLGLTSVNGTCTCAGNHVQATRPPTTLDDGTERPRCVTPLTGVRIKVQTGDFRNGGLNSSNGGVLDFTPTGGSIDFALCPTEDVNNDNCLRAIFTDTGVLALNRGDYETINFTAASLDAGIEVLGYARQITDLVYPDDTQFFSFSPYNNDGWLLAGVELQLRFAGENSWTTVYRNPCVNRFVDLHAGIAQRSIHSVVHDTAFCLYLETDTVNDAGTNSGVDLHVPLRPGYSVPEETLYAINAPVSHDVPYIKSYGNGMFKIAPNWESGEDAYNDFCGGCKTSYGVTFYKGGFAIDGRYRLEIQGNDGWKVKRIRAYHIMPGSREFIDSQVGRFEEVNPNWWLSTQSSDAEGVATLRYPASGWRTLSETTLPTFSTIQWGNGQSGAFGFGRR